MIIQKIWETTERHVMEYEIDDTMIKRLPHTFGEFEHAHMFHTAFFDPNHELHAKAYEIVAFVLKPFSIWPPERISMEDHWASGDDLVEPKGIGYDQIPLVKHSPEYENHMASDEVKEHIRLSEEAERQKLNDSSDQYEANEFVDTGQTDGTGDYQ